MVFLMSMMDYALKKRWAYVNDLFLFFFMSNLEGTI